MMISNSNLIEMTTRKLLWNKLTLLNLKELKWDSKYLEIAINLK